MKVINWVSHVVTAASRTDERRVISCLLRVAVVCRNMGNFMGVMEILSGLRQVCIRDISGDLGIQTNCYVQVTKFGVCVASVAI